jgi:hypothetical protein
MSSDELELIAALRRGDEAAFMALVERYQASTAFRGDPRCAHGCSES